MRSLRSQFILSHLVPLLLVAPLAAFALIYVIETQVLLADLSESLTAQAELLAEAAGDRPGMWRDSQEAQIFITRITSRIGAQYTLLLPSGQVLASNDPRQQGRVGQQMQIPEMNAVVAGQRIVRVEAGVADVMIPVLDNDDEVVGIVRATNRLADVSQRFSRLRQLVIGILLVELLAGAAVGLFLALRLERPLTSTTTAVEEIARGRRAEAIRERGPAEMRQLVQAVNTLSERLEFLEETRRQLLSNLVHELGRPLGALRSAIHALRHGADEDPELRQELLAGMDMELRTLEPLLDDLAQLHGQVLNVMALECEPQPLGEWLQALLPPWRQAALEKGLRWKADVPQDLPVVEMDAERMAQAVGNLLSNAIKHTRPGDEVTVSARRNGTQVQITVADSGPGIAPEEQDRIFEPFYRGQQGRFPQGLGLGLTIARDLVHAHEGRLDLESTPGAGSAFIISLPLHKSALDAGSDQPPSANAAS